jgi:hypothetical protein
VNPANFALTLFSEVRRRLPEIAPNSPMQRSDSLAVTLQWCRIRGREAHRLSLAHKDPEDLRGQLVYHLDAPGAGRAVVQQGVTHSEIEQFLPAGLYDRSDPGLRISHLATTMPDPGVPTSHRRSRRTEDPLRRPKFALKLFSSFSERLRQSEEAIESLLYREVAARLATLLSHLGNRFGEPHGSGTVIKVRLTHQDLANMIFSTREAVSKEMSEFQRAGLIEIRSRRIVVNRQLEILS